MANACENTIDVLEINSTSKVLSREKLVNEFARITQFITWPILFFLFRTLFEIRIEGRETFHNVRSPFIIVANHTSFYDSFLFRLILGWNTSHLPLRFMAVNKFESKTLNFLATIGIVDFIYSLFGVFTVTPGLGIDKNIEKAKNIVCAGGNIVIYPEGRITKMVQWDNSKMEQVHYSKRLAQTSSQFHSDVANAKCSVKLSLLM